MNENPASVRHRPRRSALHCIAGATSMLIGLALLLAACGSTDSTEPSMPDVTGKQLDFALSDIKRAGFSDDVDVDGGGTFGVIDESNWTVCVQSPAAGAPISSPPRLTVDRQCGEPANESEPSTTTRPAVTTTLPPDTTQPPAADEVLTVESNPDLAALLVGRDCGSSLTAFAEKYRGRAIGFDASIANVAPSGLGTTRFDFLVVPGDNGSQTTQGPNFKFRDVAISDFKFLGPQIPDAVNLDDKLRVTARVDEFNEAQCLFFITPIATQVR